MFVVWFVGKKEVGGFVDRGGDLLRSVSMDGRWEIVEYHTLPRAVQV